MDFDRDPETARQRLGAILNPDLARFHKRDSKILVYHRWADDMVPSETSVNFFN